MPVAQVCIDVQAVPHAPQFAGSVCVFTQAPLQFVWPVGHIEPMHMPPVQV